MIRFFKDLIKKIRHKIYHRKDNEIYYGEFIGSVNFWRLLKWNVLYFEKVFFSIKNFQIKLLNYYLNNFKIKKIKNEFVKNNFKLLNENGFVVLQNYFSTQIIDRIIEENKEIIKNLKSQKKNENSYQRYRGVPLTDLLTKLWLDENIIDIIENYLNTKLYSRMYPTLNYTFCTHERTSKEIHNKKLQEKVASYWHTDYTNSISVTIFLSDVDISKTRMQVVSKTHLNLNTFFKISDEAIKQSKKKVVDCVGKKGSVMIHCGNVVHKFKGVKNTDRLQLTSVFSSGTNLALNINHISSCLSKNFDIDTLDIRKRNMIRGIFPINIRQGYEIKNEKLLPTSYKGL